MPHRNVKAVKSAAKDDDDASHLIIDLSNNF